MTNPLESYGWSDDDYDTAIGAMVGEAGDRARGQERVNEMAGILDVAENRRASARSGGRQFNAGSNPTLQDIFEARRQFDAVTRTGNAAHTNFQTGRRAARDEAYLASLTPTQREKIEAAKQAALGIASRELRGLSKNATMTSSARQGVARSQRRAHNAEGLRTATRIGGTNFYGTAHNRNLTQEQALTIANQRDWVVDSRSLASPQQQAAGALRDRFDAPQAVAPAPSAAPYSPSNLDFGPDFSAPPSQARGAVTDPTGFSNINTATEAAPGSFANFGPNAFGALDQAPVDYGATYPEITAGLYSATDIAPPDVPAVPDVMGQFDPTNFMTETQAIEHAGLGGQRPSENVSIQNRPYGESIDQQIARNAATARFNDALAAQVSTNLAPVGVGPVNQAALTTNPYASPSDLPAPPAPTTDLGIWGGTTQFNDRFTGANRATPTFQGYEDRPPLAGLGIGAVGSVGPIGMGTLAGVNVPRDLSGVTAGMYPDPARGVDTAAVIDAIRNAPYAGSDAPASGYSAGTSAQLGTPDFSAASALDRESAYQAEVAAMRDPAATQARGAWSDQTEAERPSAISVSSPAPAPDWSLGDIGFGPGPEAPVDYGRTYPGVTAGMYEGPELSAFQPSPLGLGQGIIDQGPYSTPIGGFADRSFSPANLGNSMPNSTAVATQAPTPQREIIGYEPGKAITRDVPNPAWSEWSRDYATANAAQNAWAAADEDKFGWDRAPPNPSILSDTQWAGFKPEPSKTITVTREAPPTPIYSNPVVQAQPVNVPAVQAQPRVAAAPIQAQPLVAAQPVAAQPLARTVSTPAVGVGGWWDSFTNGLGSMLGGMSLSGLGGNYSGYGNFGGAYDPGGYGGGGYGGTAPGDAGYGSDARSGSGNMGAGNLYS